MKLRMYNTKIVPVTDDWFTWLDLTLGKDHPKCSFGVYAHTYIEITINTPEYTMLYLYYLRIICVDYVIVKG